MTAEAKVGAFTLGAVALFTIAIMYLGGFSFSTSTSYTLYVGFTQVVGLMPEADVRYAGVLAGKVKEIEPEGTGVRVTLLVNKDIHIPRDARIALSANSVLGDKFILISAAGSKNTEYLKDGDFVIGTDEVSIDSVLDNVSEAIEDVKDLLHSLNDILGNPRLKESVLGSVENVRDITAHIRDVTAVMGSIARQNESNMHAMMQEMQTILLNLAATTESVRQMVDDVADGGATAANLRLTLLHIARASENIRQVAEELHEVTGDPTVREDLKTTIHQARTVTQRANDTLENLSSIEMQPAMDILYSGKERDWITNFQVDISKEEEPERFLRVGIEDIGEENAVDLEVGRKGGRLSGRAGLIAGEAGIGLDLKASDRWHFSADAYDPNDFRLRLSAKYRLHEDTYLMGQFRDLNRKDNRALYFGLHQSF